MTSRLGSTFHLGGRAPDGSALAAVHDCIQFVARINRNSESDTFNWRISVPTLDATEVTVRVPVAAVDRFTRRWPQATFTEERDLSIARHQPDDIEADELLTAVDLHMDFSPLDDGA